MTSRQHTTETLNLEPKINNVFESNQLYNVITNADDEGKHVSRGFGKDLTNFLASKTKYSHFWYYETFRINYSMCIASDISPIFPNNS